MSDKQSQARIWKSPSRAQKDNIAMKEVWDSQGQMVMSESQEAPWAWLEVIVNHLLLATRMLNGSH